ncbi:MAG: ATP-grasp domain-containing protein [Verrucomicrobiota bacterium]
MDSNSEVPQRNALFGKRLLIVGRGDEAWGARRNDYIVRAKELGVEVVILGNESSPAASGIESVLAVDTADYSACHHAVQRYLGHERLDGILTFLEERTETAARLNRDFGFNGHSVWGTEACRNKNTMRTILKEKGLPVPRFVHLNNREEAREVASWFPTPAFLKPAHGSGSVATRRVEAPEDIVATFDDVVQEIEERVVPEFVSIVLESYSESHANLILEEYLAPAERLNEVGLGRVGVELLVQGGNIVFFAMADGQCFSPTDHRYATLTFPSRLSENDERQFRRLADDIVSVFELSDGPVILDAVMTDSGPQLYEINARIDGPGILPLVQTCYGVDLVEEALKIAVGLPVTLSASETARASAHLHMFLAASRSRISKLEFPDSPRIEGCSAKMLKELGEIVQGPEANYDTIATLMLTASTRDEVDSRLEQFLSQVTIELEQLD